MRKITILISLATMIVLAVWLSSGRDVSSMPVPTNDVAVSGADASVLDSQSELLAQQAASEASPFERVGEIVQIAPNDTLNGILAQRGVGTQERLALSKAVSEFYDLRRFQPGDTLEIALSEEVDADGNRCVEQLRVMIEQDHLLQLDQVGHMEFEGKRIALQHDSQVKTASGPIESSFFLAGQRQGVSRKILTEFYSMLGSRVDFQREIRKGDTFHVAYEESNDSPYGGVHTGRMLYASLSLRGKSVSCYRFTTNDGFTGFFDENGESIDSRFLKKPVGNGFLSSRYGRRKHPVLGYMIMHRGVDFSAPRGTPVFASGDGVVVTVGRYGNYGKFIKLKHGSEFMTGYAHLSRYAKGVKPGMRVAQGDVIGYVGSTGLATGPNLHYEVFRYGKRVNPMTLNLPPARTLVGNELLRFKESLKQYEKPVELQPV